MKNLNVRLLLFAALALFLAACGGVEEGEPETVIEVAEATEAPAEPTTIPAEPTAIPAEPTQAPVDPTALPLEPTAEPEPAALNENLTEGCVTDYDESVDYFPNKSEVTHATGFKIEYFNNYKLLTVKEPFIGAEVGVQYVLIQCGTPAPDGFDEATHIEIPINTIVSMSTTYLPAMVELGVIDRLVGLDNGLYVTNELVQGMIENGELAEIGSGPDVNVEVALDLDPDVIMTYASGFPDFDAFPILEQADLPVVLNADYTDVTPLGRAEWIDFIAVFFNEEADSEAIFAEIVAEYQELVDLTAELEERPTVFTNTPFEGTWYMPGGQSYTGQLLTDSGAEFLWAEDESTGTLFLDFETVFDTALEADYWLNIGFFFTLDDLLAADERFAEFTAFNNGVIWNNDAIINANGGNDYYESGALFPNRVLADLVAIFHPELLPDHELIYYRLVD